jgi:hypothetical protein
MDKPFDISSEIEDEKIEKEKSFVKDALERVEKGNQYLNEIDLLVRGHK